MKKRVRWYFWRLEDGSACHWAWASRSLLLENGQKPDTRAWVDFIETRIEEPKKKPPKRKTRKK